MTANPALDDPSPVDPSPVPGLAPPRGFPPGIGLNWLVRYLPIKKHLSGAALGSLIEVGSDGRGLGSIVDVSFVGIDVRFEAHPPPHMYPFSYDGGRLPFQGGSFHTAVSMDTLGNVPGGNRIDFLKELLRITASRVILGFPTGDGPTKNGDILRALLTKLGAEKPPASDPRGEYGVIPPREIEAILDQLDDWTWCPLPTAGDFVSLLVTLAEVIPETAAVVRPVLENHAAELEAWVLSGAFGPANRKVYLIERRHPRLPLVDLSNPATLINAITCPNCEGAIDVVPPGVRCRGCRASFAPSDQGIFRLHHTAIVPRAGATPGITFALNPDWSNPDWLMAVHNYLHAFPAGSPHQLWITVDPQRQNTTSALEMLRSLILPFGERSFAELFLSETPPAPGTAVPQSSERARLFDYSSEWFRTEAASAARLNAPVGQPAPATAKTYW
jgi:hypothetical protein